MPLVSVIIPTYNRYPLVNNAIESILSQKYAKRLSASSFQPSAKKDIFYEIIVVDDASSDETFNELSNNKKINYIRLDANKGVSNARNIGIKAAKGEWIALLDSDDTWMPEKLSYQMGYFRKHNNIKICQTDEIWIRNGMRVNPKNKHSKPSGWIFDKILTMCLVSPSASIIYKEVFEKIGFFDEDLEVCEDYDFWIRASLYYEIKFINMKLITKNGGHEDQLSRKHWGMDRFRIQSLEKILSTCELNDEQTKLIKNEILKKATILKNGAEKRENKEILEKMNSIIVNYS
ncbi:MAG: glycosyltransferase [Pseudomonadota bacterium]